MIFVSLEFYKCQWVDHVVNKFDANQNPMLLLRGFSPTRQATNECEDDHLSISPLATT